MTFGDDGPDDAYDAEGEPDAEQVARRLHEYRSMVEQLVGRERLAAFDALDPAERSLASSVGAVVVAWLAEHEPDDAEAAARALHNVRRYWSGNVLPYWDELPDDQQAIGVELLAQLIGWLQREGEL